MIGSEKYVLTDAQVELYIDAFFKVSPRRNSGSAPAGEWLQFLDLYNEREGHYVLLPREMAAIRPYCEANREVEMTPIDFIQLVHLIRHNNLQPDPPVIATQPPVTATQPPATATQPMDSRPRSSRMLSNSYYDPRGRSTPNHPSPSNGDSSVSDYSNNEPDNEPDNEPNSNHSSPRYNTATELETLRRNHIIATKQLRDYDTRVLTMTKEHSETIAQLQTRLEYLNTEANQQKALVVKQKQTERDRLEKIGVLERNLFDTNSRFENAVKKLDRKEEDRLTARRESNDFQEKLYEKEIELNKANTELTQAKLTIRQLEKENAELRNLLGEERNVSSNIKLKLKEHQNENTKLSEIIDQQKFDLNEARSGLRYFTVSPALDKNLLDANQSKTGDSSLAQEQLVAEHMEEIELLEKERDQYKEKTTEQEKRIKLLETEQEKKIELLETERDKYKEDMIQQEKEYIEKISLLRKEQKEDREEMEKDEEYQQNLSKSKLKKQKDEYIRQLRALENERDQYKEDMIKQRDQGSSQSNSIEKIKLLEAERDQYKKDLIKQRDQGSSQSNSVEKIKLLEAERDKYKEDMIKQENEFNQRLTQTVNDQEAIIQNLREEFGRQQALIDTIQADVLFLPRSKAVNLLTVIAWIFLAYHTSMLLASFFYLGPNKNALNNLSFYFLKRLSEWYTSCL